MADADAEEYLTSLVANLTDAERLSLRRKLDAMPDDRPTRYHAGYTDGMTTHLNRSVVMLTRYGVVFDDYRLGADKGRMFMLVPWHRIESVYIDTGSAFLHELFD